MNARKIPIYIPRTDEITEYIIVDLNDLPSLKPINAGITTSPEIKSIPTALIETTIVSADMTMNNLSTIFVLLFLTIAISELNEE